MTARKPRGKLGAWLTAALVAANAQVVAAATDISTVPLNTYSAPSSTDVKPNLLFVLDDSGSMDWNYMSDQVGSYSSTSYLFKNNAFNGVAYNPAVRYSPPVMYNADGSLNTTTYPSMTGMSTATGANSSAKPNWNAVPNDGYGVQSALTVTSNLTNNAYSYVVIPGEYCASPSLRTGTCSTQTSPSGIYTYPNRLSWCTTSALTTCKVGYDSSAYTFPRIPSPRTATITVSGASSTSVSSVKVAGLEILSATAGASTSSTTVASNIAAQINACTNSIPSGSHCQIAGYSASTSGTSVVTIVAPDAGSSTPAVTASGGMTFAFTPFAQGAVPGGNLRYTITSSVNSYSYPSTSTKAPGRSDCAGTTCTYVEEMTNYANWWAYYQTRMQMMKSAASIAFSKLDTSADQANNVSRFRVSWLTINNNTGTDFINFGEFKTTQKNAWYAHLMAATPSNSTPLRTALSTAGRLYAGVLNGNTLNGSTVTDPLQYSCQQNYTILSTDGFWNVGDGQKLNGSLMDSPDSALPRPYNDGAAAVTQQSTSQLQQRTYNSSTRRWSSWSNVSSCTATSTTQCRYSSWSSWSNVSSCVPVAQSTTPNYTVSVAKQCQSAFSGGTPNTLADVAAYYYGTDLRDGTSSTGTCTGPVVPPATTPNDLCANNVPTSGLDVAQTQHMTTFTLGLGATGQMVYSPTYLTDTIGDYHDVAAGTSAAPASGICSWGSAGSPCNWPTPASDSLNNIDDLWHAAVNGRGLYFSASDPTSLATALTHTLQTISNTPRPGTAAAAASSNPNISSTDNYVFSSSYKSVNWYGELIRQRITDNQGTLSGEDWSAMAMLDCDTTPWRPSTTYNVGDVFNNGGQCYVVTTGYTSGTTFGSAETVYTPTSPCLDSTCSDPSKNVTVIVDSTGTPVVPQAGRTIYTKGSGAALTPFQWTSLSGTQQAYFTEPWIAYTVTDSTTIPPTYTGLAQFCSLGGTCLSTAAQTNTTIATGGAAGEALVNFLRGNRSNEGSYYRVRTHVLGDIVSSEARYVKVPLYKYSDPGYSAFTLSMGNRSGTVYVAANDGMLHAFNAENGHERWAYIPSMVLPNIYKLADKDYSLHHQYLVDGSVEVGDVATCTGCGSWRTILVGGLNRGGMGYYALDVTNPDAPTLLWEFTDSRLGYTYGNPKITKLSTGQWVVMFTSGYNNTDGGGHLFIVDANNGGIVSVINTGQGSSGSPSGLAKISAHAPNSQIDNTTVAVYGGDLLGNLWRFDINGAIGDPSGRYLLATLPGSITEKPVVATVQGTTLKQNHVVIYVGTGRYLGVSDVTTTNRQSFYAIKDLVAPSIPQPTYADPHGAVDVHTGHPFVAQTPTAGTCPTGNPPSALCLPGQNVLISPTGRSVDFDVDPGWYVDLVGATGERSTTDPQLGLGTLLFTTIVPNNASASACSQGANTSASYAYALDYMTGGAVDAAGVAAVGLPGIATRPVMVKLSGGTVEALIRTSSGTTGTGTTDMGGTQKLLPPIRPPSGGTMRRVSWRELSGEQ